MRLFLETADPAQVRWAAAAALVDGVSTTPTLLAAADAADLPAAVQALASATTAPVAAPVLALDADGMYREGRELARQGENITVLVPILEEGLAALRRLTSDGVRVGATLVFSPAQALLAARAGAVSVTVFLDRLEDVGQDPLAVLADVRMVLDHPDLECDLVAAGIRSAAQVVEAARTRADIAAVPAGVLRALLAHPLTDRGLDRFLSDWGRSLTRSRASS